MPCLFDVFAVPLSNFTGYYTYIYVLIVYSWSFTEEVWPLPTHFTPRLLYKLKIDDSFVEPLPVMPWELVKKDVDEDEHEKIADGSQSSEQSD